MERALALFGLLVLGVTLGCTFVTLSPEASDVRVAALEDLGECKRIAKTTSTVKDKVWVFSRNPQKVRSELETMARNEAAREGGDRIAPLSEMRDGRREFAIYACATAKR